MLLHVRHEDVKVEGVDAFLERLRKLFYSLVVFSVVLNGKNKVQIITVQSALVITLWSGSITSNRIIREARYIQCVAVGISLNHKCTTISFAFRHYKVSS